MGIDLIGSDKKMVAVVEVGDEKVADEEIVKRVVGHNKNVKSILKRKTGTEGKYRLREMKVVWGDRNTEVVHSENGYSLKTDPQKVYFSPREATLRKYVSKQVSAGERVLVMFAGVGPYAISISKLQPEVKEVVAVEWSPDAVKYMVGNVRVNKVSHKVTPIEGEVKDVCKKFGKEFDRVIMPMINVKDFIDVAIGCTKKGGKIQVYLVSEKEDFSDAREFVEQKFKNLKIENVKKIALFAPGKFKVLMEIKLK